MEIIDLRSDTVTQPTAEMRRAMAEARVGDDVLDEDPTLHKLQEVAAEKLGKEAALFVPSGTMGNLACLLSHCNRGDEVILGDRSHIFLNEAGGLSALGGIHPNSVRNEEDGTIALEVLESSIRAPDLHHTVTRLVCLENTHNYCNGSPLPSEYMEAVGALAANHGLKIHLDGARIFNAAVALATDVRNLARPADSVMFCLSKGLSAPVGSLICADSKFIARAKKYRKMLGGGMRQGGHLAAAGLEALENLVERLEEDHRNAGKLAVGLANINGIDLNPDLVKTNIIFFKVDRNKISPEEFLNGMEAEGIKILALEPGVFRAVLNRSVEEAQLDRVLKTAGKLVAG